MKHKCDRCGFVGDYFQHNEHTCKNMRPLSEMPVDLLRKLAYKQLTEKEAWDIVDNK